MTDKRPSTLDTASTEPLGFQPGRPADFDPTVSYRNVERSDALDDAILKGVQKLSEIHRRITSCRITLEQTREGRHSGERYTARIDVTIPGGEIIANRAPPEAEQSEDLLVVVSHAFDAARRQLLEHARRQENEVKTHVAQLRGRVVTDRP